MGAIKTKKKSLETDLYEPLRNWLEEAGYVVRSEVKGCDIAAVRGEELIIVELKQRVSMDLLLQAVRRQQACDSVYVAVPSSREMARFKRWRRIQSLLRRLELGLIVVYLKSTPVRVEVVFHPAPFQRRKRGAERRAVLQEMAGRSLELNRGGSTRQPLGTAYREASLTIACALELWGPQSPKALRTRGTDPKTQSILYSNVYGWFERVDYAMYALTSKGAEGIAVYGGLCDHLKKRLRAAVQKVDAG